MKLKLFLAAVAVSLFSYSGKAQLTFSVATGIGLNTAFVGYKTGHFMPFFSLQGAIGRYHYYRKSADYDANDNVITRISEDDVRATIVLPSLGLRYMFNQANTVQTYLTASVGKVFVLSNEEDLKDELEGSLALGSEMGFGAEYYFDEHFSIGAEFGLRYLMARYKDKGTETLYDPNSGEDVTVDTEYKESISVTPTYSKITLNFHF